MRPGNPTHPWPWWLLLAAAGWLLAAGVSGPAAAAPPAVTIENVTVGFGGFSKVGSWTPVYVTLKGGPQGFDGQLDVAAPDDDGAMTHFLRIQPVHVEPNEVSPPLITYARPGRPDADYVVRPLSRTARVEPRVVHAANLVNHTVLFQNQRLFVTVGHQAGIEPAVGAASQQPGNPGGAGIPFLGRISPDRLPGWWAGYDGLDALVLATTDPDYLGELQPDQKDAIRQWVERGGRLIVTIGRSWQAVDQSVLGPMLPVRLGRSHTQRQLNSLVEYAGSKHPLRLGEGVPVADFTLKPDARTIRSQDATIPLIVTGRFGLGQVTAIALDLDQPPFSTWPGRAELWTRILGIDRLHAQQQKNQQLAWSNTGMTELASQLRNHLDQFEGIQLVSFGWVAFFIFLYILLIGPGDYFLVKKVLRRMELTWITFPVLVIVISLVAYEAAYWLKGKDLRINRVDLADVDVTQGSLRGTVWFTVFSPRIENYQIALDPVGSSRAKTPPEVVLSWFGLSEETLGGMNRGGRMDLSQPDYFYGPWATSLNDVRVQVWSTKSFTGRWFSPAAPATFEASLTRLGPDELAGSLTNRTGEALDDAALIYGTQIYLLGPLRPGQRVLINRQTRNRKLKGYLQDQTDDSLVPGQGRSGQAYGLSQTMRMMMFAQKLGSLSGTPATTDLPYFVNLNGLGTNDQHFIDLSDQLDLGRPMVVARRSKPNTGLVINGAEFARANGVSFLRVVLPAPRQ